MFGIATLVVVAILIYVGVAQRVLDRLRLTDREALVFIAAMAVGNLLPEIPVGGGVAVNIGGAVVPAILVGYLLVRAGTAAERNRAILATLAATAAIYAFSKLVPADPFAFPLDPMYVWAVIAAAVGYLAGRSRRSAFIAGVGSMILADVLSRVEALLIGAAGTLTIGGAGLFDAVIIVGILAVALAEIFGETRERLQGGPSQRRPEELKQGLSEPKPEGDGDSDEK